MNPILTIVTRHLWTREEQLKRLQADLRLIQGDIQHLVLEDTVGLGWLECAKIPYLRREDVEGEFVWILDDDDEFTCPSLIGFLEGLRAATSPDVIIGRNILVHPHLGAILYPSEKLWQARDLKLFGMGSMGSSNIIVRKHIYKENIKHFATVNRREHDWYYIEAILKLVMSGAITIAWLDKVLMRQPVASRGAK